MGDRGLADIDMMGTNGLSLRIEVAPRVQKTGNNVQSMFEAKSVNCTIDKLKIHLRETKHDLLYKIVGPVLNAMAKKRMETGIEDAIREQISKFMLLLRVPLMRLTVRSKRFTSLTECK